jgi:hypothetical protein
VYLSKKKRDYCARKLKEVETLTEKGITAIFYKSINDIRNNFKPRIKMCRHKMEI